MKKQLLRFWQSDKFFKIPILFSVLSAIFILTLLLFFWGSLPDRVPLFYSLFWGEGQLAAKEQLFLLPAVILVTSTVNILIASQLHHLQYVLKRVLTIGLSLIDVIILVTAVNILLIFI
ncbi:hypothetical protein A2617_01545 [Candidatus Daviesbacteria bacterium RIFOXYD1_FULL_41_10]|uniref:DUF1648 domain-containing protein n=2 Tax=Candidatus Daviesiibacteriota TaxID=1752718 RepID=A0A1F5MZC0_9BACT|nr:MAG: hypothetical protein UU67_C0022G0008 [Candidatus Daviesbacteria bacterium GW2011_GWB1_41_5]OGE70749.1 MAG: hypothetical protein A2617_01545 [Candidatus Daviesbacteria bacterium RIFOXYD1_FULL_41_10]